MNFTVRCHTELRDAFLAQVARHREIELAWRAEQEQALPEHLSEQARSDALGRITAQFWALRASETFRGTVTALITPHLRQVMTNLGWLASPLEQQWPDPVPAGTRRKGRPIGTPDQQFDAVLKVDGLDITLGETLKRACYWGSLPNTTQAQQWRGVLGDNWRGVRHSGKWNNFHQPASQSLAHRDRIRAGIHTTAEILRHAAHAATQA